MRISAFGGRVQTLGRVGVHGRLLWLGGGVLVQMAVEDVGGFGWRHREVDVLRLHDCGAR